MMRAKARIPTNLQEFLLSKEPSSRNGAKTEQRFSNNERIAALFSFCVLERKELS
jgi:hypothetical protein